MVRHFCCQLAAVHRSSFAKLVSAEALWHILFALLGSFPSGPHTGLGKQFNESVRKRRRLGLQVHPFKVVLWVMLGPMCLIWLLSLASCFTCCPLFPLFLPFTFFSLFPFLSKRNQKPSQLLGIASSSSDATTMLWHRMTKPGCFKHSILFCFVIILELFWANVPPSRSLT
jgi:hypothetical protein